MIFKKIRLSKRESYLTSAFIVGVLFLFQHFWASPKSLELKKLEVEVVTARNTLAKEQLEFKKLATRAPASQSVTASQRLLEKYLKSNELFSSVVTGLVENSKNEAFIINKITSDSESTFSGYTQTLYKVEVEAPFIAIGKFLEKLEDSALLTEVDSIEISRITEEMKRCKASIKLYSYVARHP